MLYRTMGHLVVTLPDWKPEQRSSCFNHSAAELSFVLLRQKTGSLVQICLCRQTVLTESRFSDVSAAREATRVLPPHAALSFSNS